MSKLSLTMEFTKLAQEVMNGKRGWVAITKYVQQGCDRQSLINIAHEMGLKVSHGGRHGYTAYRKGAAA